MKVQEKGTARYLIIPFITLFALILAFTVFFFLNISPTLVYMKKSIIFMGRLNSGFI